MQKKKEMEYEQIAHFEHENFIFKIRQPKEDMKENKDAFYVALGKMIFK